MTLHDSPLGRTPTYTDRYDPGLLFPVSRATNRATLSAHGPRPAAGVDIWTAYELSWLNLRGKPIVAAATFIVPAESPNLIESKSFKLYLNSLNQTAFNDVDAVRNILQTDLSDAAGAPVQINIYLAQDFAALRLQELEGDCIDDQDIDIARYTPDAAILRADASVINTQTLVSRLLKSNCPVTGQPDWGDLQITYSGPQIDRAQLLRYIVAFRHHAGFHEHCVERIYDDIWGMCQPTSLRVYARYTRRGGLDINPWRSSEACTLPPANLRSTRQ